MATAAKIVRVVVLAGAAIAGLGMAISLVGSVRYADAEDAASNTLVEQPTAAYVEEIYEEGDFGNLGIGT